MSETEIKSEFKNEEEHTGTIWKHPYLVYVILTFGLFLFLILMAWLALHEGWLPNRGGA